MSNFKLFLSRWQYYLSSIPTLLFGIKNWPSVIYGLLSGKLFKLVSRNGLLFKVRSLMDVWIIKETCLDRHYETYGVPLQNGWTILDIGAGLGDFSIYAAHKLPDSKIYAYEPFSESFNLLNENIMHNKIQNVQSFPYAVGKEAGSVFLNTQTEVPVRFSTTQDAMVNTTPITVITLDNVLEKIEKCDFLKMDCEGAEYDILFNTSPETLKKIKHISLEYHENMSAYTHRDLKEFLEKHNFVVKTTPNPAHKEIGFLYARSSHE